MWTLVGALGAALAAGDAPQATAQRIPPGVERPRIDGLVDDPVWAGVPEIGAFLQVEPVAGGVPSERTRIRVCYDQRALFLALECFDDDPAGIRATQMQRDARLDPDDRVEILIDTFMDRRNAFWFQIGAAGSLGDALVSRNGASFNKQWDGIFHGHARVTDQGWFAELEIPFATLNFDPRTNAFGFNARRFVRRRSEELRWASADPRIEFFWVANAGTLSGFEGLHQGLGLDVTPFVVASTARDHASERRAEDADAGLDLFYRLSPNVKLALSLNTDFAETEVDARRVNLTRFPLFFPEKRDFFLEDSGLFEFGISQFGRSSDLVPFFTRRIGLDAQGVKVPIAAAAKFTAQTERFSVGLMDVQTESQSGLDEQNLAALRASFNLFEQSDVGLLATAGDPSGDGRAATFGTDFNWRTNSFLGDDTLRWSSFAVATDNEGAGDADLAYAARLSYPNDQVDWSLGASAVERGFDPRLGFVARTGIERFDASYALRPRLEGDVRQLEFGAEGSYVSDSSGRPETVRLALQPLGVIFESGEELGVLALLQREVVTQSFDLPDGSSVAAGDYEFERGQFELSTSDKRALSIETRVSAGEFFDGDSVDVSAELDLRASAHVSAAAEWERTAAWLPGGDFTVDTTRLNLALLFTNELAWNNVVQWDDESELIGWNSRLWWILEPGSQLFVVVNQGWSHVGPHFSATSSELALKLGVTLRL